MIGKNIQGVLEDLAARFDKVLASSELVAALRRLGQADRRLLAGRPLSNGERLCLERQGNLCSDWSRVRIESDDGLEAIRDNRFEGDVLLAGFQGSWTGPDGRAWPAGMADCRVADAVIGNACLYHIARLERQVIEDGAILVGVGEMTCPAPTLFGLGSAIHPGAETGVRSVWLWDSLSLDDAMAALSLTPDAQRAFEARVGGALGALASKFGYVGKGASLLHARHVQGSYVGPGARVSGASLLREAALLSAPGEPCMAAEEAWIEKSLLQPGARVESGGKVSRSILLEHSSVAWGGMVSESVIGPNTQVHKGEVTASLLGPFVGFHHQSLLISALWPEGRGNIAYGANVGSNHTGKKPDQEIRPGEGVFFGLGCSIKFPANFDDAPYSLIATGVSTLPQRLAFPFSLISPASADPSGSGTALNEIAPGWMWSDNGYALVRRGYKFESANEARRHDFNPDPASTWKGGFFGGRLFAAGLAHKALRARQALRSAPPGKAYYREDSVPGLGKNLLRGPQRERALAAYEDYLAFFLMRTYADRPGESWDNDLSDLVTLVRKELAFGAAAVPDARSWVGSQRGRVAAFRQAVLASLARDDQRGRRIFDDYADFHLPPGQDPAIAKLERDLEELSRRLDDFCAGREG